MQGLPDTSALDAAVVGSIDDQVSAEAYPKACTSYAPDYLGVFVAVQAEIESADGGQDSAWYQQIGAGGGRNAAQLAQGLSGCNPSVVAAIAIPRRLGAIVDRLACQAIEFFEIAGREDDIGIREEEPGRFGDLRPALGGRWAGRACVTVPGSRSTRLLCGRRRSIRSGFGRDWRRRR